MTDGNHSQSLIKRMVKDVKDIIKKPLTDNGIIYSHSDENMLKGYAIIFGPPDTIYENGVYFFEFDFLLVRFLLPPNYLLFG